MDMVNRSALVVRPAQPFLDWLHRVDPTSAHLTLDDLRREPAIYLLPEWETNQEALLHLREVSEAIFEEQLNGWYRAPAVWPDERDLNAFLRWFECSFHSMVVDLCEVPWSTRKCDRSVLDRDYLDVAGMDQDGLMDDIETIGVEIRGL